MQVRCPNCQESIGVQESSSLVEVDCSTCGSVFSLLGEETVEYREDADHGMLGHFELVATIGTGSHGNTMYVVTDFVEGVTLSDWLSVRRPSARETAELCARLWRSAIGRDVQATGN